MEGALKMAYRIQLRRDTAANWTATNPVLAQGEAGYELDTGKLKIGDGSNAWDDLAYFDDKVTNLANYAGDIIPSTDNTYNLGTPEKRWKDIFVTEGSIYIGDVKLSNDSGVLKAVQVSDIGLQTEQEINIAFPSNTVTGNGTGATVAGVVIPTALGPNIFRAQPSTPSMYTTALVGPVASVTIDPPLDLTIGLGGGTVETTSATVPHVSNYFSFGFNFVNKLEYIEDEVTEGGKTYILSITGGNVSWDQADPDDRPEVVSVNRQAGTVTFDRPITWTGSFGVIMGRQAVGEAIITNNVVTGVDITDPGWGYGNTYCFSSQNIIVQENGALDDPPGNGHQVLYKTSLRTTRLAGVVVGNAGENYKNPKLKIQSQDLPSPGLDINGFAAGQTVPVKFNIIDGFITNVTLTGASPVIAAIFNGTTGDWFGNNDPQFTLVVEDGQVTQAPAIEFDNGTIFTGSYDELVDTPIIPLDVADLTDIQGLLGSGGGADTGDITFEGIKVIGAGTASGDGNGYSTLELVPDNNLYANDQYLVIDPTAPSHIHIRAGGSQDASNAELYLGGGKNYVRVTDFSGVRLYNESSFNNTEYYLDGTQFTSAAWTAGAEGQQSTVTFTSTDQNFTDIILNSFFNDDRNVLQIVTTEGTFTLTSTGFGSIGEGLWRFNVNEIPDPTPQTVSEIILTIWTTRENSLSLSNNDFTVNVTDDVRITGRDTFSLRNESTTDPITIRTDYNRANHAWEFEADGNLRLPESGEMIFSSGGPAGRIIPSVSDGIGLQVEATLDFEIKVNDGQGGSNIWSFAGSDITFPDSTTQTTAWAGGRVVDAPASSTGAEGDKAGDIAFSSGHIYYCFEDYDTGVSYNTTLSNITEDDNKFIFAKDEGIVEPEIGWSITVDVGGASEETHTITLVEDLATDWRVTWSGGNVTFDPGTAIRIFSTNIWKRVAWSNDTW
jgi:hypothetical protein